MESLSFGSDQYSNEEIIAKIEACFLEAQAGISDRDFENKGRIYDLKSSDFCQKMADLATIEICAKIEGIDELIMQ